MTNQEQLKHKLDLLANYAKELGICLEFEHASCVKVIADSYPDEFEIIEVESEEAISEFPPVFKYKIVEVEW